MNEDRSTRYHRLQRRAAVWSIVLQAAVVVLLLAGPSRGLRDVAAAASGGSSSSLPTVLIFTALLMLLVELAGLLPRFYRTFVLEQRYGLSSTPWRVWLVDHGQASALSAVIVCAAAAAVYATLAHWPTWWWLVSAVGCVVVVAALAKVAPVVLLPLFYRVRPLDNPALQARLVRLSERAGLPVLGVYEWRLGEKSRRANAALVGSGATRRILLSDTLLFSYSDDEVEVILAHELGHHAHHDLRSGLFIEAVRVSATFAVAAAALALGWRRLGLDGPADVAGLPLLLVVAGAVATLTGPALNALSRRNEFRADRFAVALTGRPEAFVSALRRLAAQNLAEPRPSTAALWLFHTHPPFEQRIGAICEARSPGADPPPALGPDPVHAARCQTSSPSVVSCRPRTTSQR